MGTQATGKLCRHVSAVRFAKVGIGWMEEIRYFINAFRRVAGRFGVLTFDTSVQPAECLNVFIVRFDSSALSFVITVEPTALLGRLSRRYMYVKTVLYVLDEIL